MRTAKTLAVMVALVALVSAGPHKTPSPSPSPDHPEYGLKQLLEFGEAASPFTHSLLGNSPIRKLIHRLTSRSFDSTHTGKAGWRGDVQHLGGGLYQQKFLTTPMILGSGEISQNYAPLNWPDGHIMIQGYSVDVVKPVHSYNTSAYPVVERVTRDEAYLHHYTMNKWQVNEKGFNEYVAKQGYEYAADDMDLIYRDAGTYGDSIGPCGPMFLHAFAAGGDAKRGPPPSGGQHVMDWSKTGYGWESNAEQMHKDGIMMMLNGHVIDLHNVTDLRGCKECNCNVTHAHIKPLDRLTIFDGARYTGGLECCHSSDWETGGGAKCPISAASRNHTYFLEYVIMWRKYEPAMKPTQFLWLDSSDEGSAWGGIGSSEMLGGWWDTDTNTLDVQYADCGGTNVKTSKLHPPTLHLGQPNSLGGSANVIKRMTGASFELKMNLNFGKNMSLTIAHCKGDASKPKTCDIFGVGALRVGKLVYSPISFPLEPGFHEFPVLFTIDLPKDLPDNFLDTTTSLKMTTAEGEQGLCVQVKTLAGPEPTPSGLPKRKELLLNPLDTPENHDAMKRDPVSMKSIRGHHSGILEGLSDCHGEYYVPPCDNSGCLHKFHNSWTLPYDLDVIAMQVHQHAGAVNLTLTHGPKGSVATGNTDMVCTSTPTYDTEGRVTEFSNCQYLGGTGKSTSWEKPVSLKKGDELLMESVYSQDALPHYGVMAYAVLLVHKK